MSAAWRLGAGLAVMLTLAGHAVAGSYSIQEDLAGEVHQYQTQKKNNLYAIARRFDLGIVELLAANPGLTPKTLKAGMTLVIPGQHVLPQMRAGVVLNLATLRLYYFVDAQTVMSFPVSVGKTDWETPEGGTTITRKRKDPEWRPTEDILEENPDLQEVVPPGKDNPLGAYALSLGIPGYAIHGTNSPNSIGKRVSHGCVRLYPEDIEALFHAVEKGTEVTIIDEPFMLGWRQDVLYLEVPPSPAQAAQLLHYRVMRAEAMPGVHEAVSADAEGAEIDWQAVEKAIEERRGVPVAVARKRAGVAGQNLP